MRFSTSEDVVQWPWLRCRKLSRQEPSLQSPPTLPGHPARTRDTGGSSLAGNRKVKCQGLCPVGGQSQKGLASPSCPKTGAGRAGTSRSHVGAWRAGKARRRGVLTTWTSRHKVAPNHFPLENPIDSGGGVHIPDCWGVQFTLPSLTRAISACASDSLLHPLLHSSSIYWPPALCQMYGSGFPIMGESYPDFWLSPARLWNNKTVRVQSSHIRNQSDSTNTEAWLFWARNCACREMIMTRKRQVNKQRGFWADGVFHSPLRRGRLASVT